MKRLVLFVLVMGIAVSLFAQTSLQGARAATGNWAMSGNRLFQNDANARLAKYYIPVSQSGTMIYEFNARYESGIDDGHGGFGIHLFGDSAFDRASWGAGRSILLWLNYDENPISGSRIPSGLSGQVYRSLSNSQMELLESVSLNQYVPLITDEALRQPVPFSIQVNGNTGEVRIYDPTVTDNSYFYQFFLNQRDLPLRGNWIALRTNGLRLSFTE